MDLVVWLYRSSLVSHSLEKIPEKLGEKKNLVIEWEKMLLSSREVVICR